MQFQWAKYAREPVGSKMLSSIHVIDWEWIRTFDLYHDECATSMGPMH